MTARFAAIGLVATDMARTLAFYRRLGLDLPPGADDQPHAEAELPGGLRLMFDTLAMVQSIDPDWTASPGRQTSSLAFECDSPADVDATYAELIGAGYEGHLAPWDAEWGQRYAVVHDPDGRGVDVFAPLATD